MNPRLSRTAGAATILIAIADAAWLVFGRPQEWEGAMRWLRHALALGALGAAHLGVRLLFPDTEEDDPATL
ncbi:hypothetical protein [Streptomyces griseus]|uniref:hypothetical protein n=1 Tax=Streptomyces griseus TaxID=1911 RepID=UPI0005656016|nr:hypothetical protein [Streptomyces griseus]